MNDKAKEGLEWAIGTVILAFVAATSQNPQVKLLSSLGAVGTSSQAVKCFQATAEESYERLKGPEKCQQLPVAIQ